MHIRRSITVHRAPDELYRFWRKLENLAEIAPGDTTVSQTSATRSHWVARGPGGHEFAWDAEIVTDEPGRRIAWESLPDADVRNSGAVEFDPINEHETKVDLEIEYTPPGGFAGKLVGSLAHQHIESEVESGLERAKRRVESRS